MCEHDLWGSDRVNHNIIANFWPTHILNNFQLTVNSNLLWFSTKLCSVVGPENSHHLLHQSDAKLKKNHVHIFSHFKHLARFHFEFSLANDNINLCSNWSSILL